MTSNGFISPESFLNFFQNLHIPPWLRKNFKFIVLRLLANTFVSQIINLFIFTHAPKQKLSPRFLSVSPRQKEIPHSSRTAFSEYIFSLAERGWGERIMELKKLLKLTRVLVTSFHDSTTFATLTFLVYVFCAII